MYSYPSSNTELARRRVADEFTHMSDLNLGYLLRYESTHGSFHWYGSCLELKTFANMMLGTPEEDSELSIDQNDNAVNLKIQNVVHVKFYTSRELVLTEQGTVLLENKLFSVLRNPAKDCTCSIMLNTSLIKQIKQKAENQSLYAKVHRLSSDLKKAEKDKQELQDKYDDLVRTLRLLSTVGIHEARDVQVAQVKSHRTVECLPRLDSRIINSQNLCEPRFVPDHLYHGTLSDNSQLPKTLGDLKPHDTLRIAMKIENGDCQPFIVELRNKLGYTGKGSTLELLRFGDRFSIREFSQLLKKNNRKDVFEEMRNILPTGTTGPLLEESLKVHDIPYGIRQKLTKELCVGNRWEFLADKLKVEPWQVRYLNSRSTNPAEEVLTHWEVKPRSTVKNLYDILLTIEYHLIADML